MITEEHSKENFSRAFVQAIAARAGVNVSLDDRHHDYGIDGSFHQIAIVKSKRVEQGITLDFQLKATTVFTKKENTIHYELDSSIHNSLLDRKERPRATPAILIVLCLRKIQKIGLPYLKKNLL